MSILDADFSQWTPLEVVTGLLVDWAAGNRPKNGTMVQFKTEGGETQFIYVDA